MNTAIEMHDSEVLSIEREDRGKGFVLLNAYVHRTDGEPGVAPAEGGIQPIRIRFEEMTVEGEVGDLPTYIFEGSIKFGQNIQDNIVPFPAAYSGPVRMSVMLSPDARVVIVAGSGSSIEAEGEFKFVEHFPGQ
jgi:hypothetical protein